MQGFFSWRGLDGVARRALSVRVRLVLLVIIAMAPLLLDRVRMLEGSRTTRLAAASTHALALARAGVERQEELLGSARALLQSLSHAIAHVAVPSAACNRLLADIASDVPWTRKLTVFDASGRAVCASDPRSLGLVVAERPYFRQALHDNGFAVSGFLRRLDGRQPALAAAYGMREPNTGASFVLVAIADLQWIARLASVVEQQAGAGALLVDPAGRVLADDGTFAAGELSEHPLTRAVTAQGQGTLTAPGFDGRSRVWGFLPVPTSGAHLLVGIDEHEILAQVDREITIAYVQLVLVALMILMGAWLFSDYVILRPIRLLARAAERIGRGDLSVRTAGHGWAPEFLPLTHSIDRMAARLASREHSLRRESERFRELAAIDGLTGLSNRRTFDADLGAAWQEAAALQEPVALLMIDVDYFKRYNDRYGHVDGDTCLRSIGAVLATVAEGTARVARYGGEEFALLLPGADEAAAVLVGEAIRETVKALGIPHDEAPCGVVTVSVGLAAFTPARGAEVASLVTAADSALYASKRTRNRVTAYAPATLALAS